MKTILMLFGLFFSLTAIGQTSNYKIIPVQAGSTALVNGSATITIDENIAASLSDDKNSYYVILTPTGDCGQLKLTDKGNKSFTVSSANASASTGSFDYVVFYKYYVQPMPQINTKIQPGKN